MVRAEELNNPIFHNCLAIASRYANNRNLKLCAMPSCHLLQSFHYIFDVPKVGILHKLELRHLVFSCIGSNNKIAYSFVVEFHNVFATIVAFGGNGKKET